MNSTPSAVAQAPLAPVTFVTTQSLLTLDAKHPSVAKALIDAQEMHRTVMSGFYGWVEEGSKAPRAQMGILSSWALDLQNARLNLVVQSSVPADWHNIPEAAMAEAPEILTVERTFKTGDQVDFRTVVNPVRSVVPDGAPPKTRGKRVAHTRPDHVKSWLAQRLQPLGEGPVAPNGAARIGADTDLERLALRILPRVTSASRSKPLRIARAEIKGTFTVTDPGTFAAALGQGIGHARAYSCGLILLR